MMGSASTAVLAKLIPSGATSTMPTLIVVNVGGTAWLICTLAPHRLH
jgi:hypothetical protein